MQPHKQAQGEEGLQQDALPLHLDSVRLVPGTAHVTASYRETREQIAAFLLYSEFIYFKVQLIYSVIGENVSSKSAPILLLQEGNNVTQVFLESLTFFMNHSVNTNKPCLVSVQPQLRPRGPDAQPLLPPGQRTRLGRPRRNDPRVPGQLEAGPAEVLLPCAL